MLSHSDSSHFLASVRLSPRVLKIKGRSPSERLSIKYKLLESPFDAKLQSLCRALCIHQCPLTLYAMMAEGHIRDRPSCYILAPLGA
jgi:hypothetical protein